MPNIRHYSYNRVTVLRLFLRIMLDVAPKRIAIREIRPRKLLVDNHFSTTDI